MGETAVGRHPSRVVSPAGLGTVAPPSGHGGFSHPHLLRCSVRTGHPRSAKHHTNTAIGTRKYNASQAHHLMSRTPQVGTIYLIHFDTPYKHARHYLGWTTNLNSRLAAHAGGQGARLMAVIFEAGIPWKLARTWTGTRSRERQLKRQGGASRRCPMCGVRPRLS